MIFENRMGLGISAGGKSGKTVLVKQQSDQDFATLRDVYGYTTDDINGDVLVFTTFADAIGAARDNLGDTLKVAPGSYNPSAVVTVNKSGITFEGLGGRGDVGIAPSAANQNGMLVYGSDVTLKNIGVAGDNTAAYACKVFGDRFRATGCKFEGPDVTGFAFGIGPDTDAHITALGIGSGADGLLVDCEFAWSVDGVMIYSSDYGASTQNRFENCRFHNNSGTCFEETDTGAIGSGRNIEVVNCTFGNMEDGTKPADFVDMDSSGYTGYVTGCSFALATNAAADLKIATGVKWVANKTEAGTSTARPA